MAQNDITAFLQKLSKTTHKYCGTVDENGFRNNNGCEEWYSKKMSQKYTGQFLYNNLHNRGMYLVDTKGDQTYFYGLFYANKLEGYGKVIYSDGCVFEGLFKQHNRYGPGVLTYSDDSQDVGFWDGFSLMRLCVTAGHAFVPRLSRSYLGRARLIKYRTLIPITPKTDRVEEILAELGVGEEVNKEEIYNLNIRNVESLLFNRNLYDSNFFTEEECVIEVELAEEEYEDEIQSISNSIKFKEDSKKESLDCTCFKSDFDRITHICAQMIEVEEKLEKLREKKRLLQGKSYYCKICCKRVPGLKTYNTESKKYKEIELTYMDFNELNNIASPIELKNRGGDKGLDLASTHEPDEEEKRDSKPEVELQNFVYIHSPSLDSGEASFDPHPADLDQLSKLTLPFNSTLKDDVPKNKLTLSYVHDNDTSSPIFSNTHSFVEESEVLDHRDYSEPCQCDAMHVENVNILQEKMKDLSHEELFYETVKTTLQEQMDVDIARFNNSQQETKFTKKTRVTNLLAWNNEQIWIKMLQNCFRHKNSEKNLSYSIDDVFTSNRNYFRKAGGHEIACGKFLEACYLGNDRVALNYLRTHEINPDVCDAKGNTGVMLAAVSDKTYIIGILAGCGGKVDAMNDDGLTPLSMSLLKYISLKHQVFDWELAFLHESIASEQDFTMWRFPLSMLVTGQRTDNFGNLLCSSSKTIGFLPLERVLGDTWAAWAQLPDSEKISQVNFRLAVVDNDINTLPLDRPADDQHEQKYIFDTEYKKLPEKKHEKKKHPKKKKSKKKKGKKSKKSNTSTSTRDTQNKKKKGKKTKKSNTSASTSDTQVSKNKKKTKKSNTSAGTRDTQLSKNKKKKEKKSNAGETTSETNSSKKKKKNASLDAKYSENGSNDIENEDTIDEKLEILKKTIKYLLARHSDPNIGEVPLKPLFLTIYTNDPELMEGILQNKADPNVTTEENLSCLHVIASLKLCPETIKMSELLLKYNIDPNIKTSNTHWHQLRTELLGKNFYEPTLSETGKNALHLLCVREDFLDDDSNYLEEIASILVNNGCKTYDLYLGHSPLSLAVFRGTIPLIKSLLKTEKVNPHLVLGDNMGNALTILVLNRFSLSLSLETKKKVADCLISNGLNPLNGIDNFENAIAFMKNEENEASVEIQKKPSKRQGKKKGRKKPAKSPKKSTKSSKKSTKSSKKSSKSSKKSSKSSKKSSKSSKKSSRSRKRLKQKHKDHLETINMYIEETTRKQLFRHLQSKTVESLYTLIAEGILADPLIIVLAKHVTPEETIKYIKLLFRSGIISQDRFSYAVVSDLLQFVKLQHHFIKLPDSEEREILEKTVRKISRTEIRCDFHIFTLLSFPELERGLEKYEVCFQCLQRNGKMLVKCPSCELVSFCSEECNSLNNKTCDLHKCKIVFYNTVRKIIGDEPQPSRLEVLLEMANKVKEERLISSELNALEERMSKLRFKRKALIAKLEDLQLKAEKLNEEKLRFARSNSIKDLKEIYSSYFTSKVNFPTEEVADSKNVTPVYKDYVRKLTENTSSTNNLELKFLYVAGSKTEADNTSADLKKTKLKNTPKKINRHDATNKNFTANTVSEISIAFQKAKILPPEFEPLSEDIFKANTNEEILTRTIPNKEYYMKLLSRIFADFNIPLLLLPYACYKDGQVYYSMNSNMYLDKNFQRLKIPS